MASRRRNVDHAARQVIVASYIYYVLDNNIMSDPQFDRLCRYVADNWSLLHPDRQWALGTPGALGAGGSHIKYSTLVVDAASSQYLAAFGDNPDWYPAKWKRRRNGTRYVTAGSDFREFHPLDALFVKGYGDSDAPSI